MISDEEIAKQISNLMFEVYGRLQQSLAWVEQGCSPAEYAAYRDALGGVVNSIMFDVLDPLYCQHPAIKPDGWDD